MKITLNMIKARNLNLSVYKNYFTTEYDEIEYQNLIDECINNNDECSARWLINSFGFTNETIVINNNYRSNTSIIIAGNLIVTGAIKCKKSIIVGGTLKSGWSIRAAEEIDVYDKIEAEDDIIAGLFISSWDSIKTNGSIIAGWNVEAGGDIETAEDVLTGKGYGVIAGQRLNNGIVVAKNKPENLICGRFRKRSDIK